VIPDSQGEADVLARYLIGRAAPAEVADRYARACRAILSDDARAEEQAIVAFALRHPWALGALDGACALVRPGALLRRRVIIMAAVLETTPMGAAHFLPRARSTLGMVWTVVCVGATAVFHAAIGLPLLALAQRGRS
jgi:hypothetical protein